MAELHGVAYVSRDEWGARAARERVPLEHRRRWSIKHHSVTGGGVAAVRSIQQYHMDRRGYWDIAYNWLIDSMTGVIYEGRGMEWRSGATEGWNAQSQSVCFLGNLEVHRPKRVALDASRRLDAALFRHGRLAAQARVIGHSDTKATTCPGRYLEAKLDYLRTWRRELEPADEGEAKAMGYIDASVWPNAKAGYSYRRLPLVGLKPEDGSDGRAFLLVCHNGVVIQGGYLGIARRLRLGDDISDAPVLGSLLIDLTKRKLWAPKTKRAGRVSIVCQDGTTWATPVALLGE